jgi:hypothetical protein
MTQGETLKYQAEDIRQAYNWGIDDAIRMFEDVYKSPHTSADNLSAKFIERLRKLKIKK